MEPHFRSQFQDAADYDFLFDRVDHPQLGITVDTGHFHSAQVDTKAIETDTAQLAAVWDEATHGVYSGQMPVADAVKKMTTTLDGAGRQALKDKLQKQFDDWRAANPNG